ncbi:MAG: SDR family oxidoreductase [Hyphomicrobiales bacterium]|nr:MAG: SDR family oxidoreductase [Hyphomicrobiales bacterium]
MTLPIDFHGKNVLVFGGTTGINFGIATAFVKQGANITVVSRKEENVRNAIAALSAHGRAEGVSADVRDFEACGAAVAKAVKRFGPLDVVVSGAAGNFMCEASELSSNGFRAVVDIDLVGTFHALRQSFQALRRPGASVINITAPQSCVPMRYQVHACAAKAGVDQLTRVLALEWGREGVRVNAISPGPIEGTEGFDRLIASTEEQRTRAIQATPLRRMGTVADIADLALFLASPHASYISGAVIPCDGGGAFDSVKPALELAGAMQQEKR